MIDDGTTIRMAFSFSKICEEPSFFSKKSLKVSSFVAKNSITSKWNNGILEGTVCKIKTAKRIMAGRASITLLEKKVALKL
jgi:transposase